MINFIILLSFFFHTSSHVSCSCSPITVEENIKSSDAIFTAKVVKIDSISLIPETFIKAKWSTKTKGYYTYGYLITLKLKHSFKGNLNETIYLVTGNGGGDCGYYFNLHKNYLIYTYNRDYYFIDSINKHNPKKYKSHESKNLTTTICDRTTDDMEKEEKLLTQALQKEN